MSISRPAVRAAFALALLAITTSVATTGCLFGCGAAPVRNHQGKGAKVDADGVVVFDKTWVGSSISFEVPVKDTADVDETLMSATVTGDDADDFVVSAAFPVDMPAGKTVHVEVTFEPHKAGDASAELVIVTKDMGESPPIALRGVGAEP